MKRAAPPEETNFTAGVVVSEQTSELFCEHTGPWKIVFDSLPLSSALWVNQWSAGFIYPPMENSAHIGDLKNLV